MVDDQEVLFKSNYGPDNLCETGYSVFSVEHDEKKDKIILGSES
jgi:hypothetical protein